MLEHQPAPQGSRVHDDGSDDGDSDPDSFAPAESFTTAWDPPSLHFYTSPIQQRFPLQPLPTSPTHPISVGSAGSAGADAIDHQQQHKAANRVAAKSLSRSGLALKPSQSSDAMKKLQEQDHAIYGNPGMRLGSPRGSSEVSEQDLIAALRTTWDSSDGSPENTFAHGAGGNLVSRDGLQHWASDSDSEPPSPSQCEALTVSSESPPPESWMQEAYMPLTHSPLEGRQFPQDPAAASQEDGQPEPQDPHGFANGSVFPGGEQLQRKLQDGQEWGPHKTAQQQRSVAVAARLVQGMAAAAARDELPTPQKPTPAAPRGDLSTPAASYALSGSSAGLPPPRQMLSDGDQRRGRIGSSLYGVQMSGGGWDGSCTEVDNPIWQEPCHCYNSSSPDGGSMTAVTGWTDPAGEVSPVSSDIPTWPGRNAHRLRVKSQEAPPCMGDDYDGHIPPTRRSIRHPIGLLAPRAVYPTRGQWGHAHSARPGQQESPSDGSYASEQTHVDDTEGTYRQRSGRAYSGRQDANGDRHDPPSRYISGRDGGLMRHADAPCHHHHSHMPGHYQVHADAKVDRLHGQVPHIRSHGTTAADGCPTCSTCHRDLPAGKGPRSQSGLTGHAKRATHSLPAYPMASGQAFGGGISRRGEGVAQRRPWQRQVVRHGAVRNRRRVGPHPGWTTSPDSSSYVPSQGSSWSSPEPTRSPPRPRGSHPAPSHPNKATVVAAPTKPASLQPAQVCTILCSLQSVLWILTCSHDVSIPCEDALHPRQGLPPYYIVAVTLR